MRLARDRIHRWGWPFGVGILLMGTISYISPGTPSFKKELLKGQYALESIQKDEHNEIKGPVYFEYTGQKERHIATRIFKLHFVNSSTSEGPGYGFLIPLADSDKGIVADKYRVDPESRGLMNGFRSVFGYADLKGAVPSLYFTESGSISIIQSGPEEVSGKIDMILEDGSGNSIHLEGSFRALPLPSNLSL
ncbi:MAG: hypothetical protein JSW57_09170 [Flavobacteriaceae bacterium]|nr:MAG: hypothetical protein JSW57_09170 [Flavobacteriaceae bacterium]